MKRFLFLMIFLLPIKSYAISSKEVCEILVPYAKQIQEQLPIVIDPVTTLTGVNNIYTGNNCTINYIYLVNTNRMISDIQNMSGLTYKESLDYVKSDEYRSIMEEMFNETAIDSANLSMKEYKKVKNITVNYIYMFDRASMPSILAVGLDT